MATESMSTFLHHLTRQMAAESLADQSDQQLVERALAGRDEAVLRAIVRRHGGMVYRVCCFENAVKVGEWGRAGGRGSFAC